MIFVFASALQRWSIFSPSRLTTPSTPSKAAAGGRSRVGSQGCHSTPGCASRAFPGLRLRPRTSSSRASSASHSADPISPVAPVTRTFTVLAPRLSRRVRDRREGAGLLVEAGGPVALGPLPPRFGDLRGDVAVEDAGDDVVLGQIGFGDRHRDSLGGGQLHLLGDAGGAGVEGAAEDAGGGEHVVDLIGVVGAAGGHES